MTPTPVLLGIWAFATRAPELPELQRRGEDQLDEGLVDTGRVRPLNCERRPATTGQGENLQTTHPGGERRRMLPLARTAIGALLILAVLSGQAYSAGLESPSMTRDQILEGLRAPELATAPGADIVLEDGEVVPGIKFGRAVEGSPPPFAVPEGGSAVARPTEDRPDARDVVLTRANGRPYAIGTLSAGAYDELWFFAPGGERVLKISMRREESLVLRKPRPPRSVRARKREMVSCGVHQHNDLGVALFGSYMPFYVPGVWTPVGVDLWGSVNSMLYGADTWNSHQDYCNVAEANNLQFTYAGGTYNAPGALDGVNAVGFSPSIAAFCPGALACTPIWGSPNPYEIDILFNPGFSWQWTGGAYSGSKYDIESVAVHEFGHAAGLGHVGSAVNAMYPTIDAGDTTGRLLGRGEAEYINTKY